MSMRLNGSDGPVLVSRTPSPDQHNRSLPSGSLRSSIDTLADSIARLCSTPPPQSTSSGDRPASPPRHVQVIVSSSAHARLFDSESPKVTDDIPRDFEVLHTRIGVCDPYKGNSLSVYEDCKAAKSYDNVQKNRYPNTIPTDVSRVRLQHLIDETDYVNASFFKQMILTQGPLETTLAAFWTMLFEQNCKSLVCLTNHLEPNRLSKVLEEKTYPYWNPTLRSTAPGQMKKGAELFSKSDIELRVICDTDQECVLAKSGQNNEHVLKQTFSITLGKTTKQISFFHYVNWIDHAGADVKILVEFIKILRACGGPFAFNCSAGIGRSGTLAALMDLIQTYELQKCIPTERNVLDTIISLRTVRLGGCITGSVQLRTIFEALREYILH